MHKVHHDELAREQLVLDLDEIARQGAQKVLAHALQAEVVDTYTSGPPKASVTSAGTPRWSGERLPQQPPSSLRGRHDRG